MGSAWQIQLNDPGIEAAWVVTIILYQPVTFLLIHEGSGIARVWR